MKKLQFVLLVEGIVSSIDYVNGSIKEIFGLFDDKKITIAVILL